MKKIGEIKEELQAAQGDMLPVFIKEYEEDERNGVKTLVAKARKRIEALEHEIARTEQMKRYEKEYASYGYICGIDEVGRGPLAGPVVAGAVILPKDCKILYLNDSKQLTAKKRDELYDIIMEEAVAVGLGFASYERIDEINILQATFLAMRRAISQLHVTPDLALIDGNRETDFGVPCRTVIKGDSLSANIAAASVLAKVSRDRYVTDVLDKEYPQYRFAQHKGYGTALHRAMLDQYGLCPEHRLTFLKKRRQGREQP